MPFSGSPANSRFPSPVGSPKTAIDTNLDIYNQMEFPLLVKVKLEPKIPEKSHPSSASKLQPFFYPVQSGVSWKIKRPSEIEKNRLKSNESASNP